MAKHSHSEQGSYGLVLRDLRARRDRLEALIKGLEETMRTEGIQGMVAKTQIGGSVGPEQVFDLLMASVRPGEFHNMSYPIAAKAILEKANRHPLTTQQILQIIERSGRKVEGKTPGGTIYTALARTEDFEKVQKNTWGLREWYPTGKRTADHE